MIKLLCDAKDGPGKLLTCVIDDANIDRIRRGNPLYIRLVEIFPNLSPPIQLLVAYHGDLRKAAENIQANADIGQILGSFEPHPLVAMVGLARSGKSTIVRDIYQVHGYAVVCPDAVRLALHGQRFIESTESFVWATVELMVDSLRLAGSKVVVDATNITAKRREPWIKRGAKFHVVETPKDVCIERAKAVGDEAIIPVIERQAAAWEPIDESLRVDQLLKI